MSQPRDQEDTIRQARPAALGPYTTVLVAILKEPRDLDIAREQHWYRIPVRRLPARAAEAPVLAFYQTRAFGEERWAVRYYALARRWTRVRRVDIFPDEASHPRAQDPYWQVWLGPLHTLPRPVVSRRWRRITFIVTHWQRLFEAETVEELQHGTIFEERLWQAMRQLGYLAEDLWQELREWLGA